MNQEQARRADGVLCLHTDLHAPGKWRGRFSFVQNSVEKWETYVYQTTIFRRNFDRRPHKMCKTFHNSEESFALFK